MKMNKTFLKKTKFLFQFEININNCFHFFKFRWRPKRVGLAAGEGGVEGVVGVGAGPGGVGAGPGGVGAVGVFSPAVVGAAPAVGAV